MHFIPFLYHPVFFINLHSSVNVSSFFLSLSTPLPTLASSFQVILLFFSLLVCSMSSLRNNLSGIAEEIYKCLSSRAPKASVLVNICFLLPFCSCPSVAIYSPSIQRKSFDCLLRKPSISTYMFLIPFIVGLTIGVNTFFSSNFHCCRFLLVTTITKERWVMEEANGLKTCWMRPEKQ